MKLTNLEINNYRTISHVDFSLESGKTLFVGKNNSGKTTILNFINLVCCGEQKITFDDCPFSVRTKLIDAFYIYFKEANLGGVGQYLTLFNNLSEYQTNGLFRIEKIKEDGGIRNNSLLFLIPFMNQYKINENDDYSIQVCFELITEASLSNIGSAFINNKEKISDDSLKSKIRIWLKDNYSKLFIFKVYAVEKSIFDTIIYRPCKSDDFKKLFNIKMIKAQRPIEVNNPSSGSELNNIFKDYIRGILDDGNNVNSKEINRIVDDFYSAEGTKITENINKILNTVYARSKNTSIDFITETELDLIKHFIESTNIAFKDKKSGEIIPAKLNGLGYKNLMLLKLSIAIFVEKLSGLNNSQIVLLLIEEPEAHTHPQAQEIFVKFLEEFVAEISSMSENCQILITTHSPHIANIVDFSSIRYLNINNEGTYCRNLKDFANKNEDTLDFLSKYLSLTKCDIFFADKVILVEGTSERLLLPKFIEDISNEKEIEGFYLDKQYYSLIEVGGAFAYLFIPLLEFLDIPSLIITDIDLADKDRKKCYRLSEASQTTNETIKHWLTKIGKPNPSISDIVNLDANEKRNGNIAIAYQTIESDYIGRSLEEAIINVNKNLKDDIDDFDCYIDVKNWKDGTIIFKGKKTDFALNILLLKNINIPHYIKEGLLWLNGKEIY